MEKHSDCSVYSLLSDIFAIRCREMWSCLLCEACPVENVKADQGHFQQWEETTKQMKTPDVWWSCCALTAVESWGPPSFFFFSLKSVFHAAYRVWLFSHRMQIPKKKRVEANFPDFGNKDIGIDQSRRLCRTDVTFVSRQRHPQRRLTGTLSLSTKHCLTIETLKKCFGPFPSTS